MWGPLDLAGENLHEAIYAPPERAGERGKANKAPRRRARTAGESGKADGKFRPGRTKDDQIYQDKFRKMRNPAAGWRPTEGRSQKHRGHAEESLRHRPTGANERAGWSEPERGAGLIGGAAGSDADQEGRQHLRYAERQRARAMIDFK